MQQFIKDTVVPYFQSVKLFFSAEIDELRQQFLKFKAWTEDQVSKLWAELAALRKWTEEQLAALRKWTEEQLAALRKWAEDEFAALRKWCQEEFAAIRKEIADLRKWTEEQLAALRDWAEKEFVALRKELADLKKWVTDELAALKKWAEDQIAALKKWTEEQVASLKSWVESTVGNKMDKNFGNASGILDTAHGGTGNTSGGVMFPNGGTFGNLFQKITHPDWMWTDFEGWKLPDGGTWAFFCRFHIRCDSGSSEVSNINGAYEHITILHFDYYNDIRYYTYAGVSYATGIAAGGTKISSEYFCNRHIYYTSKIFGWCWRVA